MKGDSLSLLNKYRSAIMGAAALWIYFFHLWFIIAAEGTLFYKIVFFVQRIGYVGVDVFFFLSGIGLTYAIQKNDVFAFYVRRLKRIIPSFLIIGIIIGVLNSWGLKVFVKKITGYGFLFESIYSFLWFVPAIMILYLVFPWLYMFLNKAGDIITGIFTIIVIWLFISIKFADMIRYDFYGFTNRIPIFLTGILFATLMMRREWIITRQMWILIMLIYLLGLYFSYLTNFRDYFLIVVSSNCFLPTFLIAITGSLMLSKLLDMIINSGYKRVGSVINKVLSFFGTISLEFYCVQEWLGNRINGAIYNYPTTLKNVIIFVCVTAAGYLLHRVVGFLLDVTRRPLHAH